jgi:FtsP/CotA-like multicopper oxidase with cupredoxin domain
MDSISKHVSRLVGNILAPVRDPFARDIAGLPEATAPELVELRDGAVFALRAGPVRKRIGEDTVKMLAYNGSVPGPTLKVMQGSEVTITFTNALELATTVHWHGLRLDNRFDGVPQGVHHGMQPPIPSGGSFTYRLRFPDAGVYWYHPHIREDYTQEHGLYGTIIVAPRDPADWSPVNRDLALTLDDILIERDKIAPFSQTQPNRTAMGRFGNVMLVNGETSCTLTAHRGEVLRLYLTNTANVRPFNVRIAGARMKLVGSDSGRVEHEQFIEEVLLAPAERAIVDVLFERAGQCALEHRTPDRTYTLGTVDVDEPPAAPSFAQEFASLRRSEDLTAERARIEADFDRPPDKTIALVGEMPGMQAHGEHQQHGEAIEWEDTMELHNRMTTPENMLWKVVDQATGNANHDIHWSFKVGDRVKIRIINEPHSDHPMQHPVHVHGQRFLILSRDGVPNANLAWKDTVLLRAGETVDVLLDVTNPGVWMVHCHIAEHLESDMMFTFHVQEQE